MQNVIIDIRHLSKTYRLGSARIIALEDICLTIRTGEICSIVGPSGSGKSTLLHQLAGLEKPTKGSVHILGENISNMTEDELALFRQMHLGFIFQSYNLLNTYTAIENVALPLMFQKVDRFKRLKMAKKELEHLGLRDRLFHKPTEMSGGQQQRVGIARAFVTRPKVVFADEPTGNLDSATTKKVLFTMLSLAKKYNITFIMVTHERELAECANHIVTIVDGKITEDALMDSEATEKHCAKFFGDFSSINEYPL